MIHLLALVTVASGFSADPYSFSFAKSLPPYGIPEVSPSKEKELEIEEIVKKLSLDKSWPFMDKEISFDKDVSTGIGKEFEFEKELGFSKIAGLEKSTGFAKAIPWSVYEKYFGLGKKMTFEQALTFELYKQYGYYGLWVARELQRRFLIAKELGLIGREIEIQEAITLGLFKGIGLEKIFEAVNRAIGAEKTFEFEKGFGIFKRF